MAFQRILLPCPFTLFPREKEYCIERS